MFINKLEEVSSCLAGHRTTMVEEVTIDVPQNYLYKGRRIMANKKLTTDEFIEKSRETHGDKYDYSKTIYNGAHNIVTITCPHHGDFNQQAHVHKRGNGCKQCATVASINSNKHTTESFIDKAHNIHGSIYDYSLVEYEGSCVNVDIICSQHGVFKQKPYHHLLGRGCKLCGFDKIATAKRSNKIEFINKSKASHSNKYDYSLVEYVDAFTDVKIICNKHGVFNQKPHIHVRGHGCPICKLSKGEFAIMDYLISNDISYIRQYTDTDCKDTRVLRFDFHIPEHNTMIEFDGIQHFKPIERWGGDVAFEKIQIRDRIKDSHCIDNNIEMIRIPYFEINNVSLILDKHFKI